MTKFLYLLFILPLFFSCQSEKTISKYPAHVGDIQFDEKVDDANFKKCFVYLF